jgi:hypothetical protein
MSDLHTKIRQKLERAAEKYLVNNFQPITNLIECLTKSDTIVGGIHLNKAKKGMARLPQPRCCLFYPCSCDRKVSICVRCLPRVAGKTDFPGNKFGLSGPVSTKNN